VNPRQAQRVVRRGELATAAVIDSIDETIARGGYTRADLGELEVALASAEVITCTGRRWEERPSAVTQLEEALERLEVALLKWRDIIVAEIKAEDA